MNRRNPRERVLAHHRDGAGLERIAYPIGVRTTTVVAKEYLTPKMLRLTLGGPGLDGLHTYQADDHVKIVFPDPDGTHRIPVPNDDLMLDWPHPLPPTRKYTIRRYDAAARELDLDLVVHPGGLAAEWARSLETGAGVVVAGPPGAKSFPHNYDHYLFAVDATALPAVARWLDESPDEVSAHVVIEVEDEDETKYPLAERAGVTVDWLVRPPGTPLLASAVKALPAPGPRTFLFAAGEADTVKPLRTWSRELGLPCLVTGYWKRGIANHDD